MENEEIYNLLRQGEIIEVEKALQEVKNWDKKLLILATLIEIFHDEVACEVQRTVFDYSTDIDALSKHYTTTKLLLRRIEFDMPKEYIDELYEYCENTGVSVCMICKIIRHNIIYKEKVCLGLSELFGEKKGKNSWEHSFYIKLSKSIGESENGNQ